MNEQVQQMMALARQQQAVAQQGVDVGACGPMAVSAGMAGLGQGGFPAGVQGCAPAPAVPAGMLQQNCDIYQECFVALGIQFGVDQNGGIYPASAIGGIPVTTSNVFEFQLFPRNGNFWIFGLKIFTDPNVAEFNVVQTGDSDWNHMLGNVDVATWNTTECFCPVNWGCISITNPLRIQARALTGGGVVQGVRGACWGIRRSSNGSCGPFNGCAIPGAPGMGAPAPMPAPMPQ